MAVGPQFLGAAVVRGDPGWFTQPMWPPEYASLETLPFAELRELVGTLLAWLTKVYASQGKGPL